MRKYILKTIICIIIISLFVLLNPNNSKAVLQANKPDENNQSLINYDIYEMFKGIRQMETKSGTLGKESNINVTTGKDEIEGGNGIDCHMIKNIEWGTVALLSASAYGTAPNGESNASTTGNNSGIFQMADSTSEYVAWVGSGTNLTNGDNKHAIFGLSVMKKYVYVAGDANNSPKTENSKAYLKWYGSISGSDGNGGIIRGNKGIFSVGPIYVNAISNYYSGVPATSRAVVVCGDNF